ncbi:hypothetical protein [Rhizobium sp. Root1220]|uniref:hypothetical protein n=1 Tax=Rhizobium sp. Root1220 TaxID=1736432 RepID=UPI0006FC329D|nr:hypothetical protein [Rhizobium sp. Root1220]KQV82134.1 hypothetical protein ASC90_23785 [Rhizobium sp. Root1220]
MANLYNENAPAFSGDRAQSALTAFFDSRSDAESAVERLREAGVPDARFMPGYEADTDNAEVGSDDRGGFFEADWFLPNEDRDVYGEGLRRGGFLVSAEVNDITYDIAHQILGEHGSIDMDERADLWKTEGWSASRSGEELADTRYDQNRVSGLEREQQELGTSEDVFAAEDTRPNYRRRGEQVSPRVRSYELDAAIPFDLEDDVLPTGHQRDVWEGERPRDPEQSQSMGDLRQDQAFPRRR